MKPYTPEALVRVSRYQNYFPTLPENEFYFECNECIYQKILGRRGLLKLGAMCCQADIINYGNLPYTDFIRKKTLCRGGDLCDFRFVRHETDAGDGWERTESV